MHIASPRPASPCKPSVPSCVTSTKAPLSSLHRISPDGPRGLLIAAIAALPDRHDGSHPVAPAPLGAPDRLAGRRSRPQAAGCLCEKRPWPAGSRRPSARGGLARLAGQQGERFFPVCRPVATLALWGSVPDEAQRKRLRLAYLAQGDAAPVAAIPASKRGPFPGGYAMILAWPWFSSPSPCRYWCASGLLSHEGRKEETGLVHGGFPCSSPRRGSPCGGMMLCWCALVLALCRPQWQEPRSFTTRAAGTSS